jgi:hypothetical protein
MPGGDRTGPMGAGPMTGWGRGVCGRWDASSTERGRFAGAGQGFGGGGRGWRHRFWASGQPGWVRGGSWRAANRPWDGRVESTEDERRVLERDAEHLESELQRVRTRLDELDTRSST